MFETSKRYKEIASFNIGSNKQMVISENAYGNLILAKRVIVVDDDEGEKTFFEKGSTFIKPEYRQGLEKFIEDLQIYLKK